MIFHAFGFKKEKWWGRRSNKNEGVWKEPTCRAPKPPGENQRNRPGVTFCMNHVVFAFCMNQPLWFMLFLPHVGPPFSFHHVGPLGSCGLVQRLDFRPFLIPSLSLLCSIRYDVPLTSFIYFFFFLSSHLVHSFNCYLLTCLFFWRLQKVAKGLTDSVCCLVTYFWYV